MTGFFEKVLDLIKNTCLWLWNDATVAQLFILVIAVALAVLLLRLLRKPILILLGFLWGVFLAVFKILLWILNIPFRWFRKIKCHIEIVKKFRKIEAQMNLDDKLER